MRNKIPFVEPYFDYREQMYLQTLWHTRQLTEGDYTRIFERLVANSCGREYGIATNSGSSALFLLLKMRSFPTAKDWNVTDYCFIAPHNAIRATNGTIVLHDIEKHSLCAGPEAISGPSVVVHYNNHKISSCHYGADHVHDIAHCIGTDFSDIVGDLAISFSSPKFVTTGQGGMILTNDPKVRDEAIKLKNHGRLGWAVELGGFYNLRLNEIASAIGISQMEKLQTMQERKADILDAYTSRLKLHNLSGELPWLFVYQTQNPAALVKWLDERNVEAKQLYEPIHRLWNFGQREFPNSDWAYNNLVYLPSSICMRRDDVNYVCDAIEEYNVVHNR